MYKLFFHCVYSPTEQKFQFTIDLGKGDPPFIKLLTPEELQQFIHNLEQQEQDGEEYIISFPDGLVLSLAGPKNPGKEILKYLRKIYSIWSAYFTQDGQNKHWNWN